MKLQHIQPPVPSPHREPGVQSGPEDLVSLRNAARQRANWCCSLFALLGLTVGTAVAEGKLASDGTQTGTEVSTGASVSGGAGAVQITGAPGSPSAVTTIDGKKLPPPPDKKFGGKIGRNAIDPTAYWPPRVAPAKGSPNILLIMTDDAGYWVSSTFGGVIPTPAMDRVARNGLHYTHFHSTSVCSPTRASLISGRNHHQMGTGAIPELSTGYPGYNGTMTKDNATVARILKGHGYVTSWFGKNHNTPDLQISKIGAYDQWPIGLGFDYFYGFMGGDTSQWRPGNLVRNTTYIYPYVDNPGWNMNAEAPSTHETQ